MRATAVSSQTASSRHNPVLVTGGAGFIGANLVDRLATDGEHVLVFDVLARAGVERNLSWLRQRHPDRVQVQVADILDRPALAEAAARASSVFHLAAQVAVTTSLDDPEHDFDVNLRGTMFLLEALRRRAEPPPLIFASTNKVYGNLADVTLRDGPGGYMPEDADLRRCGIGEDRPLQFYTPYGCSKGAADQYVLDYARSFGIPACVLRMSCIYGPRQMGTEDQGWLAHFLFSVLDGRSITIYGDGLQVRDVLFVHDAVQAYLAARERIAQVTGEAFNLGGGASNAVTLRQVIREIETIAGRSADVNWSDWRPGDQRYFVADTRKAAALLALTPPVPWRDGLRRMVEWARAERKGAAAPQLAAVGNGG